MTTVEDHSAAAVNETPCVTASPWLPLLRGVFRLIFTHCGGIAVEGQENIPRTGRLLICPNHISDSDPSAVLVACPRNDLRAMAKSELFTMPVLGGFIRAAGAFPVKRDSADRAALRYSEAILEAEQALLLFPEGRCSENGRLQRVQPGAAMLALKTKTPILPVGLIGTNRVLPYGAVWPRFGRGEARVIVGKLIEMSEFEELSHKQSLGALTERLGEELARLTVQAPPRLPQREEAEQSISDAPRIGG